MGLSAAGVGQSLATHVGHCLAQGRLGRPQASVYTLTRMHHASSLLLDMLDGIARAGQLL